MMTETMMGEGYTLIRGDCLDVLPGMAVGSVDAVVTDPPYGIGFASDRQTQMNGTPRQHRSNFGVDVFDCRWIAESYRVLKNDSLLYCFTRWDVLHQWKAEFEKAGFKSVQRLIWDKCHWKMGDLQYYGSQVEDVLVFRKGSRPIFPGGSGRRGNIFRHSSGFLPEGQEDHPTQKPVALLATYILDCTNEGDAVLDPFMGSGSAGVAALKTGRYFIGYEIDQQSFAIAARRIADAARAAAGQPKQLSGHADDYDALPMFAGLEK